LLMVLGRAAEWNGDLREAVEVYARAERSLRGWSARYYGPMATARRAFALAALGDLDGAEACARALPENAHVTARASGVRARALVLAKRGAPRELLDLLEHERRTVRGLMVARDRTLLRTLAMAAKRALEPATREAAAEPAPPEPTRAWIASVYPAASA